jgi:signal transduction histidine kinase
VFLHSTRDVTAQRLAEARVKRGHESQRLVNDLLRIALQPLSLDEILEQVMDRLVETSWLAQEPRVVLHLVDDTGQRLAMKVHRGIEPAIREACATLPFGLCLCGRAASSGEPVFSSCLEDGHDIHVEGMYPHGHYCVPIRYAGQVLGVLSVAVDSGHERAAEELDFLLAVADVIAGIVQRARVESLQREHQRVAQSRERMARVGEISAGVAHTVRNPLHGVMSCVEIVSNQAGRGEPASAEILGLMRDGLERIEKVTRRLLALTREAEPDRRLTMVGDLIGDLVDLMSVQASRKPVALVHEPGYTGEALLDSDRVMEGLMGVISNAIDASDPGGRVHIRVSLQGEPTANLIIEVEDHGCGIPKAHLPHVTDAFFTTKPIGEGSGLGLAITRRIMDEHGGDIQIQSREGEGTLVRLTFPSPFPVDPPG